MYFALYMVKARLISRELALYPASRDILLTQRNLQSGCGSGDLSMYRDIAIG